MRIAYVAGLVGACGGERSEVNTALVCFGSSEAEPVVEAVADEPLSFVVSASLGCHTADLTVGCTVTMDGDTLTVETETTWVAIEPLAMGCESIALAAEGSCDSPSLAAGTWTVRYGDNEQVIDVPGPVEGCL